MRALLSGLAVAVFLTGPADATDRADLSARIEQLASGYLAERGDAEHFTGVSVSLSLPGQAENLNLAVGALSRDAGAGPMTPDTLFQIGSITKSMTAAVLLQLQTEGRLGLDDTLAIHLPEYPAWRDVTLRRLLTMTSGIPSYDTAPAMIADTTKHGLGRYYSPAVLVGFVDPAYPGAPGPTTGYDYSNTNYILAGMVIERITGEPLAKVFNARLFGPRYGLTDTYYAAGPYWDELVARMPSGTNWQPGGADMAPLLGKDFKAQDMSWGGAAGAALATPEQVTRWVRALYQSDLLTAAARADLMDVVSMKTGERIGTPFAGDPAGFGLGVMGFHSSVLGQGWQYEGGTMGFRVVYVWLPAPDIVVAVGLNSNVNDDNDHIGTLAAAILQAAMAKP
jgi:D-alanyl-D-alanine carboxypeptidase